MFGDYSFMLAIQILNSVSSSLLLLRRIRFAFSSPLLRLPTSSPSLVDSPLSISAALPTLHRQIPINRDVIRNISQVTQKYGWRVESDSDWDQAGLKTAMVWREPSHGEWKSKGRWMRERDDGGWEKSDAVVGSAHWRPRMCVFSCM